MDPVAPTLSKVPLSAAIYSEPTATPPPIPADATSEKSLSAGHTPPMTWKNRGYFHMNRQEFDLAIDNFTQALQEAERQNNKELIADSLQDLGRVFLEKKQWSFAAKIFSSTLALLPHQSDEQTRQVHALMAAVDRRFLASVGNVRACPNPNIYDERRVAHRSLRQCFRTKLDHLESVPTILNEFSLSNARFLETILNRGHVLLGPPPWEYAVIGLGSLARKEMCPFSDLEFALLVAKNGPKELEYFRKLVQWLELQVIHLGETALDILDKGHESPVECGFCFDEGGNTPLGKQLQVELIKTPEELAQFQSDRFYQEDLILSNTLRGADILVGSETLYQEYRKGVRSILNSRFFYVSQSVGQKRALSMMRGHLVEFEPRLDRKKEEAPIFNVKIELYRPLNFLIAALADYFGIEEQNTWKSLEALIRINILSPKGAESIQQALAKTMQLRIRCHLHYGKECDDVYHPSMQVKLETRENILILSDSDIATLIEIYQVILPLYRIMQQSYETQNFASLAKETFYDASPQTRGEAYERLQQFTEAKQGDQQAVALSPDNPELHLKVAHLLYILAEYPEAKNYTKKALTLGKTLNNEAIIATATNMLGLICHHEGDAKQAVIYHAEALKILQKIYGAEHPAVAGCLNFLGKAWMVLGNTKKAITFFEEALRIAKKNPGDQQNRLAAYLNNLGLAWKELGYAKKAIALFEEALNIVKKISNDEHSMAATCYGNLGLTHAHLGNVKIAIDQTERALRIDQKIYGNGHPQIALRLINLAEAWQEMGQVKKAIGYLEEALKIHKKVYSEVHPKVSSNLNNLGVAWRILGDAKLAIAYYEEALEIVKKIHGDHHPAVATCMNNLGHAYHARGDSEKAMKYCSAAVQIYRQTFGDSHPLVITTERTLEAISDAETDAILMRALVNAGVIKVLLD